MTDDKIYTPEILEDTPFPGQEEESLSDTQKGSDTTEYSPSTIKQQPLPRKMIAHELLNTRLNTKTGNILGQFNFQPSGALQIGKYVDGESGDIRISPNGIVARDMFGVNTFAIDGETGDAVFRGTVMANGFIVSDENGIRSIGNFSSNNTSNGYNQDITSTSYVDLTDSSQTFTLDRQSLILMTVTITMYLIESAGNTGDAFVAMDVDGVVNNQGLLTLRTLNNDGRTYSIAYPMVLSAGQHTIKLKGKFQTVYAGTPVLSIREHYMSRVQFGN